MQNKILKCKTSAGLVSLMWNWDRLYVHQMEFSVLSLIQRKSQATRKLGGSRHKRPHIVTSPCLRQGRLYFWPRMVTLSLCSALFKKKKSGFTGWGQVLSLMPPPVASQARHHSQAPDIGQRKEWISFLFCPHLPRVRGPRSAP